MLQFLMFSAALLCIQELEQLRQNLPSLEIAEQKAREVLDAAEAAVEEEQRLALANETEGNGTAGADTPELEPAVQEPTSKSDSGNAGVDIADIAQKPVVSEYSKWMDGAEKVLEADGEEKPVVSEYSKWMDGAEKVLEPKVSKGSEPDQKAADSHSTEPDAEGADGTPGLTRLKTKVRDLWSSFKGWIFGNKTAAEKALDRARQLHNAAKKKLKQDRVKIAQLAP